MCVCVCVCVCVEKKEKEGDMAMMVQTDQLMYLNRQRFVEELLVELFL